MTTTPHETVTAIGQAFVRQYYTLFDTDRAKLANFYAYNSEFTFEGVRYRGQKEIVGKLGALNFKKIAHNVKTVDCQEVDPGVLVFCCGDVKLDDSENGVKFSQVFLLMPTDASKKSFSIHRDVFRLNYG